MKVAVVQNEPMFGVEGANIADIKHRMNFIEADLFVLPELAWTGYQFKDKDEVLRFARRPEEAAELFIDVAQQKNAGIIVGFPELGDRNKVFNSSLFLRPDGTYRVYRKSHLFYKEKELFTPGDSGFFVTAFRGVRIGMAICFDWFYPESFRTLAKMGADLIAHSANLVMPYCQRANFARAVENRVYIATANRIGTEDRAGEQLRFTGGSVIVSPKGEYLAEAPTDEEAVIVATIDPAESQNKALNPYNTVLEDLRTDIYL